MPNYKHGSHTVYDLRYHIVWITKYRYHVMVGDIAVKCRDYIREICKARDVEILSGKVGKDHVHMYISMPPFLSVSKVVQYIKGKSSRKLLSEYKDLQRRYWGQHLWARGYFVTSVGEINDEVIRKYIEGQHEHHDDAEFTIDV